MTDELKLPVQLDEQLDYAQKIRLRLANSLIVDGMPESYKEQDILLRTLEGVDRSALQRKQLAQDEANGNQFGNALTDFIKTLYRERVEDPFRSETPVKRDLAPKLKALDDKEVTEFMVSTDVNLGKTDYESFNKEFLEKHPEYK